jgi:hypothetical protein
MTSLPWLNRGRGDGNTKPLRLRARSAAAQATEPRATTACNELRVSPTSRSSHAEHAVRSADVGALPGGAHRTAATTRAPVKWRPSAACADSGCDANPAWYNAANSQSPLRSPVKIRPVRLPPWAAGAKPTMSSRGAASPKPGTGRPQYGWLANDRRFVTATSSRQATRRGQARHTDDRAVSSARSVPAASRATSGASVATGVASVARSLGQPVPGGGGLGKLSLVPGCANCSLTSPILSVHDRPDLERRCAPR